VVLATTSSATGPCLWAPATLRSECPPASSALTIPWPIVPTITRCLGSTWRASGGQANLVAFNNLYSGTGGKCGNGNPTVLFSYDITTATGGKIITAPVLSLDGKKIAFVESAGAVSIFHVLTWASGAGNGTSATTSAVPGAGNSALLVTIP
jgi:hypothetical protein